MNTQHRIHPIDLIRCHSAAPIGFDETPTVVDLCDPDPESPSQRSCAELDLSGDGGEWEPLYAPLWFVATSWFVAGAIAGMVAGLWKATH